VFPRSRLTRTTVALAAVVAAAPTAVHAASAAAPAYRTQVATVTVHDGPTGHHTATLDTRLYLPRAATKAHPQPAILMTHGFGLSKDAAEVTSSADFFARHGYVVLTYTSQGFGASTGCIRLDSFDYDAKDASALISQVLAKRPEVRKDRLGPVVGMLGGSYGGGITLNVAEMDRRVRAIAPGRTWNSLQYALYPNNWVVPGDPTGFSHQVTDTGVFKREWTSLFFASGNAAPFGGLPPSGGPQGSCPQEKAASGDPQQVAGVPCTGYPTELCRTYASVAATGDASATDKALLMRSSGATFINRLRVPTLLVQGQSDTLFNENDALATYTALRRQRVPVALIWNSGGHGGYDSKPGEGEVYGGGTKDLDHSYLPLMTLSWFDRWLRGDKRASVPGFAYYRDWVPYSGSGPDDEQYATARAYPAQRSAVFKLSAAGWLSPPGLAVTGEDVRFANPPGGTPAAYSETSNFSAPGGQAAGIPPSEQYGQYAAWTSPPFNRAVVSVGVPRAHLHLANVNGQSLVLFAKVYDVAPDGSAELIHRLVAPARIPQGALGRAVDISLLGFAHRFAAGHSVRFVLSATDAAYWNSPVPDLITVRVGPQPGEADPYLEGGKDPSWFSLPVDNVDSLAPGGPGAH
jgi:ABC-2 type transport system ATP-binding protein